MFTVLTASTQRHELRPHTSGDTDALRIQSLINTLRHDLGAHSVTHLDDLLIVKVESGFGFGEAHALRQTSKALGAMVQILKICLWCDTTVEE